MRIEISGKSTGVGAYEDGYVVGYEPDYVDTSKTGNHWTSVYKNVPADALVIEFGHSRGGVPFRRCSFVNGDSVPDARMGEVQACPEWNEFEP